MFFISKSLAVNIKKKTTAKTVKQKEISENLKSAVLPFTKRKITVNISGITIKIRILFSKSVLFIKFKISKKVSAAAQKEIKKAMPASNASGKCKIIIATVKGDIHDIGKNIVKLLLENYGFAVTDLGKDVPPEEIVKTAKELDAPLVGLSALMTTTVPAMEETIKKLRSEVPECKVMVGGAVMTEEYASMINADSYSSDAMGAVRYAESLF